MEERGLPSRVWIEIGVVTAVALGLHLLAPGLSLIPVQMLVVRHGRRPFNYVVILLLVLGALMELALNGQPATGQEGLRYLRSIGVFLNAALLGGLWLLNESRVLPYRNLLRILAATGAAGLIALPFFGTFAGDPDFVPTMSRILADHPLFAQRSLDSGVAPEVGTQSIEQITMLMGQMLMRMALLFYMVYLIGGWWLGSLWGARTLGMRSPIGRLFAFRVEPWFIWIALVSGAVVLADRAFGGIGVLSYVAWNILAIFLFLFGLQGIGVLQWLCLRYGVPGPMRVMIGVALVFMLFSNVFSLVPVLGLPLLGMAETWVDFKRPGPGSAGTGPNQPPAVQ